MTLPVPYPYQEELLAGIRKGWEDGFRKQLVVSPTGSGKTKCFSWQTKDEVSGGRRVLILVDQKELITQTVRQLKDTTGLIAQVERAEFYASKMCPVVAATIQTMASRKNDWPPDHFALVIADEADKSISPQWMSVLKYFDPAARVTGYTATPNRTDKRNLGEYYENIAFEISLLTLVQQGYLSPICIQMSPLRIELDSVSKDSKGDYDATELGHAITPYLGAAVDVIKQFAPNRKTLVFLPLIKTSQAFVDLCRAAGIKAEHIDGGSVDRTGKLERFRRNEFSVLANSSLLLRGYDDPDINCVFVLRPTTSATLFSQCVGRGTRIAKGKENLLLIDCLWQTTKHMVMRPGNLIAKSDEEAAIIADLSKNGKGQQDLLSLANAAQSVREETLRKKLEALAHRKSKFISAEQFALQHGSVEAADYAPTMHWHMLPPTEKQSKYLEEANINLETVKGTDHATKLLDVYFKVKNKMPANQKVKWMMSKEGWRSPDNLRGPWQATIEDQRHYFANRPKKPRATKIEAQKYFF